jgi:hypothetical protein
MDGSRRSFGRRRATWSRGAPWRVHATARATLTRFAPSLQNAHVPACRKYEKPEIVMEEGLRQKAYLPIKRMLDISKEIK